MRVGEIFNFQFSIISNFARFSEGHLFFNPPMEGLFFSFLKLIVIKIAKVKGGLRLF